jgi:hypothetical protein
MCCRRRCWFPHAALHAPFTATKSHALLRRHSHHPSGGWCWNPYGAAPPRNGELVFVLLVCCVVSCGSGLDKGACAQHERATPSPSYCHVKQTRSAEAQWWAMAAGKSEAPIASH